MEREGLVGVAEIAESYGVSKQTVNYWTNRDDFPIPRAELASGRIWGRGDVALWHRFHAGRYGPEPDDK